jgi:hypothetical protein
MEELYRYFTVKYLKDRSLKYVMLNMLFEDEMIEETNREEYLRFYLDKNVSYITLKPFLNNKFIYNKETKSYLDYTYKIPTEIFMQLNLRMKNDPRALLVGQIIEKRNVFQECKNLKHFLTFYESIQSYSTYDQLYTNNDLQYFKTIIRQINQANSIVHIDTIIKKSFEYICEKENIYTLHPYFVDDHVFQMFVEKLIGIKYILDLHFKQHNHYEYMYIFIHNIAYTIKTLKENYIVPDIYPVDTFLEICKNTYPDDFVIHILNTYDDYDVFFQKDSFVYTNVNNRIYAKDLYSKYFIKFVPQDTVSFSRNELITEFLVSQIIRQNVHQSILTKYCLSLALSLRFDACFSTEEKRPIKYGKEYPGCIFYEYVEGNTLYDYAKKYEIEIVREMLIFVFLTLQELYEQCKFTHYDLHLRNILVTENDELCNFKYKGYTIKNTEKLCPVICDFGRSRVEYNDIAIGRCFSVLERDYLSINYQKSYPATDIFKLIFTCYLLTKDTVYEEIISGLFEWDMKTCKQFSHVYYNLEYLDKFKDIQYKDVLPYLLDKN